MKMNRKGKGGTMGEEGARGLSSLDEESASPSEISSIRKGTSPPLEMKDMLD